MADLRERLAAGAGPVAAPPDLDAIARGAHRRVRRGRRAQVGGAALLVAVLVGGGTLAIARDDDPVPSVDVGPSPIVDETTASSVPTTPSTNASSVITDTIPGTTWVPIAASPLAEREAVARVWTGSELIVFGGIDSSSPNSIEFGDGESVSYTHLTLPTIYSV